MKEGKMVAKCPFYIDGGDGAATVYRAFGGLLGKLESAKKIEYVWRVLGEHENFRMTGLLIAIDEAMKWPRLKTDEMAPKELDQWQSEVAELCESLASKLEGSRIDRFFSNRTDNFIETREPADMEMDPPKDSIFSSEALLEIDELVVMMIAEATRGGWLVSECLRKIADSKETDALGRDSFLEPIHILNRPSQSTAKHSHFAHVISAFFMEELGNPQRECVAVLIAALFDCEPPPKRNIRRWAPYEAF
jgi:hypothetical protein